MRSLTLKAALAALLISTPLATAYAAPHEHHHEMQPGGGKIGNDYDPLYPPTPFKATAPTTQYDAIVGELQATDSTIATDQAKKLLTPGEVRSLRADEGMIRKEAANAEARHHDVLPSGQYHAMLAQIDRLDNTIHDDAHNNA